MKGRKCTCCVAQLENNLGLHGKTQDRSSEVLRADKWSIEGLGTTKATLTRRTISLNLDTSSRSGTSNVSWVAAEHRHARAKFGATKGNHVFAVKY